MMVCQCHVDALEVSEAQEAHSVPRLGTVPRPAVPPLVLLVNDGGPPAPAASNNYGRPRTGETSSSEVGVLDHHLGGGDLRPCQVR